MRALFALFPLVLLGAATPSDPLGDQLRRAQGEAAAAAKRLAILEREQQAATGDAARFAAERRAAGAAIEAAEARLDAADVALRVAEARQRAARARLDEAQAPSAALLAGLVSMDRRPPLLALADDASVDELVRIRALLDTTMPVIRQRTRGLSAELVRIRREAHLADTARANVLRERQALAQQQARFAALEKQALSRAATIGAEAFGASDSVIANSEVAGSLEWQARASAEAMRLAREVAAFDDAPAGPDQGLAATKPPIAYQLPLDARVTAGLGSISPAGIRSRGVALASQRGAALVAPASGRIAFAGPFRSYDGVIIIDHGGGTMTLITGASTQRKVGEQVERGAALGRALGPITVELSTNGRPISGALISGSSARLSNAFKRG